MCHSVLRTFVPLIVGVLVIASSSIDGRGLQQVATATVLRKMILSCYTGGQTFLRPETVQVAVVDDTSFLLTMPSGSHVVRFNTRGRAIDTIHIGRSLNIIAMQYDADSAILRMVTKDFRAYRSPIVVMTFGPDSVLRRRKKLRADQFLEAYAEIGIVARESIAKVRRLIRRISIEGRDTPSGLWFRDINWSYSPEYEYLAQIDENRFVLGRVLISANDRLSYENCVRLSLSPTHLVLADLSSNTWRTLYYDRFKVPESDSCYKRISILPYDKTHMESFSFSKKLGIGVHLHTITPWTNVSIIRFD